MSGVPKPDAEDIPEITRDMIVAGISAIEPFDLQDAIDGYLGHDELVMAIYRAMYCARPSNSEEGLSS